LGVLVFALDFSGIAGSMGATLVLALALLVAIVSEGVWLPVRFWRHGLKSVLPLLLLLAAFPVGALLGGWLLELRLKVHHERYEAIAARAFAAPELFKWEDRDRDLAYSVRAFGLLNERASAANPAVGVSFIVVTHGFAGRVGFLRVFDKEVERRMLSGGPPPGGWKGARPLRDGWFVAGG
jgi:hypothetical protein